MLTEAEFQEQVTELARLCGWRCLHVRRSIGKGRRWQTTTSIVGWVDLLLWRPGRIVAIELKTETGAVTTEQAEVIESLKAAGVEAFVARPSDFDRIVETLGARRVVV